MEQLNGILDETIFDCPHCNTKNTTYTLVSSTFERQHSLTEEGKTESIQHKILKCNNPKCGRITYFQLLVGISIPVSGYHNTEPVILFQYPSRYYNLPNYIPQKILDYYKEAIQAYDFNLLNSASVMCRKAIYEICDKNSTKGKNYKEKIKSLGLDKRITDPLLNIKTIGDDTVHATGWDAETILKSIEALGIIIDMIYTQEERIKSYSKHFSKKKQENKKQKSESNS